MYYCHGTAEASPFNKTHLSQSYETLLNQIGVAVNMPWVLRCIYIIDTSLQSTFSSLFYSSGIYSMNRISQLPSLELNTFLFQHFTKHLLPTLREITDYTYDCYIRKVSLLQIEISHPPMNTFNTFTISYFKPTLQQSLKGKFVNVILLIYRFQRWTIYILDAFHSKSHHVWWVFESYWSKVMSWKQLSGVTCPFQTQVLHDSN